MKLKRLTIALKWLAKTGRTNTRFQILYRDLNALYYRQPVKARLVNGVIVAISTMKGGVEICSGGERYYLRLDQFNNEVYVQREDVATGEWDNLNLWDRGAETAQNVLKSLIKHNPFVPSEEGVRYVG